MLLKTKGAIIIAIEKLACPRCSAINNYTVTTDIPAEDWLICGNCGYKALLDVRPIMAKHGIPFGLSRTERRDFTQHLKKDVAKI